MTTPDERLIALFADGEMPTGDNFKTLITSMATKVEFDLQKGRFDEYISKGVVHLGPIDKGWSVTVEGSNKLAFSPDVLDDLPRGKAHLDAYGWIKCFGRLGTDADDARFSQGPLLSRDGMDAKPCGAWVPLLQTPSGLAAFELVVATPQYELTPRSLLARVFFKLVGVEPLLPDVAHAVITARDATIKPEITRTVPTRFAKKLKNAPIEGTLLALVMVAIFLVAQIAEVAPGNEVSLSIGVIVFALAALRRGVQLFYLRRSDIRLRWKKAKDADANGVKGHVLQVYGPKPANKPDAKFSYHITALWG